MSFFEQFGKEFMTYPQDKWRQWLFKFPVILWRMGLGPLMGRIFVLITATGRKSGKSRHVLAEYYQDGDKIYVISGYGEQSQWYKNLMANPYATVQTWQSPQSMKVTRVTDAAEIVAVFEAFKTQRDPVTVHWYLESLGIPVDDSEAWIADKEKIYVLRFEPTDAPTPMPLSVDLAWIWPVLLLLGSKSRRRQRRRTRRMRRRLRRKLHKQTIKKEGG